jgi:type II secretory pathway component GspD/PulD (secretin)
MLGGDVDLPVRMVELPDGKIRIIWVLRNYGGSSVTSTRDAATARRNVVVAAPDLAPLVALVTQQLGASGTVLAMPASNTLIITCNKETKGSMLDLLARLDIAPRQVEIRAKIFEVKHDFDFQQGARMLLRHLGPDNAQTGSSTFDTQRFLDTVNKTPASPFQGSVLTLMQASTAAGLSLEASFQLLAESGLITVVSSPRMTVAVGQTGYLLAGQELPIQSANLVNGVLQTTTSYKPVGVQLYITPQAAGQDRVKLHTISIVSTVSGFTPLPTIDGQNSPTGMINPVIDSREAETAVSVQDGNTLVISGLQMIRTTTRENKVPGLGDIPLLGWFFKSHRSQQESTDLYFFVTPTLM